MYARFVVNRIKPVNQTYVSALRYSPRYASESNPLGMHRLVIQPAKDSNGDYVIKYKLNDYITFTHSESRHPDRLYCSYDGYMVSGEGHVVTGKDDKEIMRECNRYLRMKFDNAYAKMVGPGGYSATEELF